jgi:hypothetical protein
MIAGRSFANYCRRLAEHPDLTPEEAQGYYRSAREWMLDALTHEAYCDLASAVAETLSDAADAIRRRIG